MTNQTTPIKLATRRALRLHSTNLLMMLYDDPCFDAEYATFVQAYPMLSAELPGSTAGLTHAQKYVLEKDVRTRIRNYLARKPERAA